MVLWSILLAFLILVGLSLAEYTRWSHYSPHSPIYPSTITAEDAGRLTPFPAVHLLIPLTAGFHNRQSCKTLRSALVHGYQPTIINWVAPDTGYRGNQFAKISGEAAEQCLPAVLPRLISSHLVYRRTSLPSPSHDS